MNRFWWPLLRRIFTFVVVGLVSALMLAPLGCSLSGMASSPPWTTTSSATTSTTSVVEHSTTTHTTRARTSTTAPVSTTTSVPRQTSTTSTTAVHVTTADPQAIAKKVRPSVVGVTAVLSRTRTKTVEAIGTGVVYSAAGLIITNNHVVTGETDTAAKEITVTLPSGAVVSASLVGRDPAVDLAVLRVRAKGLKPAVFRTDLSQLAPGDFVVAIGNAKVLSHPVTSGQVIAVLENARYEGLTGVTEIIESTVQLAHGNSGGPLVDAEGRVIGINVAELVGETGGLSLPADMVIEAVKRLAASQ
jgi:S1-C subfamily serine protease